MISITQNLDEAKNMNVNITKWDFKRPFLQIAASKL